MMRLVWTIIFFSYSWQGFCQDPSPNEENLPNVTVSNGERVFLNEKDFSIVPPNGWEIHRNRAGASFLFQIPFEANLVYQRTIQVLAFEGAKAIDRYTGDDFAATIIEKFSAAAGAVTGYRMRNKLPVELRDGTEGYLYYTEFNVDTVALMQLHILISSADRHFLMTYTDVAEHFDTENGSPHLEVAYSALISAQVGTQAPSRFQSPVQLIVAIVGVIFLGIAFRLLRRKSYVNLDDDLDEKSENDVDNISNLEMEEHVEEIPNSWNLDSEEDDTNAS